VKGRRKKTGAASIRAAVAASAAFVALSGQAFAQQAPQGNAERAKNKISMCIGCHGIPGYKSVYPEVYNVPKIGGQNAGYITVALKAYRTGERNHPSMRGIAGSLTDEDIADLAAYYGGAAK
jgi:cytochrome c553